MQLPLVIFLALGLAAGASAEEHLLAGARNFREGRYTEALTEFREAQRLGAADAGGYAAATLIKLERPEEALELFESGPRRDGDALMQYYRALACYGTRMLLSADAILAGISEQAGPRGSGRVRDLRARISEELATEPAASAVDFHLERCASHRTAGRLSLAAMYCREAKGLAARRADHHGLNTAAAILAQLDNPPVRDGGK